MVGTPSSRGFTLTELLAVVAVMAILASIATPSFSALIGTMRARATSSDLYASLSRARSEAIKRNAEVSLAPTSGPTWQGGWSIADPADSTHLLDVHLPVVNGTVTGPAIVTYRPNGRVKTGADGAFDIAIAGQAQHRCVRLDLSGRPLQSATGC